MKHLRICEGCVILKPLAPCSVGPSDVSALDSHAQQIIKNKVAFLEKPWLTDLFRDVPYSFPADPLALALEVV